MGAPPSARHMKRRDGGLRPKAQAMGRFEDSVDNIDNRLYTDGHRRNARHQMGRQIGEINARRPGVRQFRRAHMGRGASLAP